MNVRKFTKDKSSEISEIMSCLDNSRREMLVKVIEYLIRKSYSTGLEDLRSVMYQYASEFEDDYTEFGICYTDIDTVIELLEEDLEIE